MPKRNRALIYTFCLLMPLADHAMGNEFDQLNQEIQRLKNEKAVVDAEKNLNRAEKFLKVKKDKATQTSVIKEKESSQVIKGISIDLASEGISLNFDPIIKPFYGKPLTSENVLNLVKELTSVLYQAGYSTSAIGLKKSEINDGNLDFIVHWGYVDNILVNDKSIINYKDKAMVSVLPNLKGKLLNIYDIDQFVDVLNTNNKKANIKIVASEGYGKSNVNILTERSLLPSLTIGFNNSGTGNNANGRNQVTANLIWSDLIGSNDTWSFNTGYRIYKNHNKNNQQNYALSYIQPFSYYTLEARISQSDYEKELKGYQTYLSSGKTKSANVKLSKILTRNKDKIFSVYGELEFKKRKNYIANRSVNNLHHNKFTIGLSYISQFGGGKLYSDFSFSNGLNWFGANKLAYKNKGETTLRLISASINWYKPLALVRKEANYQMRIGAQYSPYSLYSDNQISIGDEYTVRGFKGSALSGDKGIYLSQTLTLPFYPQKPYFSQISPFIGFDIGRIYQKNPKLNKTLSGIAFGMKARINKLSLSFTYAKPMTSLNSVINKKSPVYYVNGSFTF